MTTRTVTTQAELDAALAEGVDFVDVQSPAGVWLEVTACGSSTVTAYDSSTVPRVVVACREVTIDGKAVQ